jgi:hypothetical protein
MSAQNVVYVSSASGHRSHSSYDDIQMLRGGSAVTPRRANERCMYNVRISPRTYIHYGRMINLNRLRDSTVSTNHSPAICLIHRPPVPSGTTHTHPYITTLRPRHPTPHPPPPYPPRTASRARSHIATRLTFDTCDPNLAVAARFRQRCRRIVWKLVSITVLNSGVGSRGASEVTVAIRLGPRMQIGDRVKLS